MPNSKLKTFNVKKDKKLQAKKRKLEAFLNLVREDESACAVQKKKSGSTFAESYKALKDELRKYQKKQDVDPVFYLIADGKSAKIKFSINNETPSSTSPLFVEDIYQLLLKSVLANLSPFPLRWAKLERANSVSKTVLIEIEGLSEQNLIEMNTAFNLNFQVPYIVEFVSSDTSFATELSTFHLDNELYSETKRNYSAIFPVDETSVSKPTTLKKSNLTKLHLMLSPIQLAMEHYPLPQSIFEQSKSDGYCFSKDTYTPIHPNSPMFAVDCEMCKTLSGKQEVTRIAIVNENLEIVYHTLVKPEEEIVDYITRYSGITEKMLRDVKTTLGDVQRDIQRILPSDAILCGQSLNCDLHALKMIHPYVIDTSVIFNENGIRQKKTSLKQLARIHLKESIQDGKKGHNPVEDSIATMKLVQLKLKNSVEFGDAVLSPDTNEDINTNDQNYCAMSALKETQRLSKFVNLNSRSKEAGFFSRISRFSKKTCLIGDEDYLNNYCQEMITDNVTQVTKSKIKNIMKEIIGNLENSDLILSHLALGTQDSSVVELNEEIKQLYDNFPNRTLFIILMPGVSKALINNFKHNLCMISLKR